MALMSDHGQTYWGDRCAGVRLRVVAESAANRNSFLCRNNDNENFLFGALEDGHGGRLLALSTLILAAGLCVKSVCFWLVFGSK
jgi:hypothetical protein